MIDEEARIRFSGSSNTLVHVEYYRSFRKVLLA